MAYNKINFVNDTTEVSAENMNHIEDGIEKAYGQLLLAVDSTAPSECSSGDRYFNTETNKIYTATGTNTWGTTGVDAELGVFYIILETQNIYTYNGTTLVSVGGGAGGGGTPIGTIEAYSGSSAPNGYLLCDGSAVSRTTYKDLFRVIGTTYGAGDGSTTFNLPNIKGRTVVMLDTTQTEFDALGETGGSKYLQEHTHSFKINSSYGSPSASSGGYTGGSAGSVDTVVGNVNGVTTGNSGNLQPYIVLNYIIRVQQTSADLVLSEQLPVGSEIDFDGTSADIPIGWEQVSSIVNVSDLFAKTSLVGTLYVFTAIKVSNKIILDCKCDISNYGNLFTIDNSIKPISATSCTGSNYSGSNMESCFLDVGSDGVISLVRNGTIEPYLQFHLEWYI